MKRIFVFLGLVIMTAGSAVRAQEVDSTTPLQKSSWGDAKTSETASYIPEVSLDMRGGLLMDFTEKTGSFFGDGLYLDINGQISPHFSYSVNHRIASSYYEDNSGFNGTNWLTLTYETDNFYITAGKDALLVGSFEYDAYDLDTYYNMNTTFYNEFDCWQWGVSAAWYPAEDHELILQFANSPFSFGDPNLFSYALGWRGAWDWYESYWTANLWQLEKGSYMKAANLGNRFSFGSFTIDLDFLARFSGTETFTSTLAPAYEISDWGRVFVKAGWESGDNVFGGAGFEYFPLKEDKDIRLHAAWSYNENMSGHTFDIGLTWKMNLTKALKSIF